MYIMYDCVHIWVIMMIWAYSLRQDVEDAHCVVLSPFGANNRFLALFNSNFDKSCEREQS